MELTDGAMEKCLSILELKGWQSPPSSRNWLVLKLADDQLDFPGICSFLQSSLDLETLVIDWFEDASRLHVALLSICVSLHLLDAFYD
uniref:Uncharacterized protein n=1 Tax=Solanum tuberosum TaxID=4113 RepID=M1B2L9_SOLTU